jgi:tetratricopeptide (TPR) repeat protein
MTTTLHHSLAGRAGAAALAVLLGAATAANAQTNGSNGNTINIPRAEALEAQAVALYPAASLDYGKVARLYDQAARLRPDDDPARVYDLRVSAIMYQRAHKLSASLRNLTLAAETALQYGDVVMAANTFVDAAWVAREQQDIEAAIRLFQKAECLSRSPLMSLADARALRSRLGKDDRPVWVKQ